MVKEQKYSGKAWFRCTGVRSDVLKHASMKHQTSESIGHICMLDIENHSLNSIKTMVNNMFDVAFVLESSETGYHVYNPVIRSLEETKELMDAIYLEDEQHTNIGYKRGDWVLRISDKPAASKKVPEYVHSVINYSKRKTFSAPHLKLLHDYFGIERAKQCLNKLPTDGKTLEAVEYKTYK